MRIKYILKDGKTKALTMSYDDGNYEGDTKLVEIFNKYGIKGTFHLNGVHYEPSGSLFKRFGSLEAVRELYKGHEISMHAYNHPFLERLPKSEVIIQMLEDKKMLEEIVGYPVRGMSYPFGTYNDDVLEVLNTLGIRYSRTTRATQTCTPFPNSFLEWHPTTHHAGQIFEKLDGMLNAPDWNKPSILYIWGHSYEFNAENPQRTWEEIEEFCKKASENKDRIWFATNIEICDYYDALKRVEISYDRKMFYNPSNISVWFEIDGKSVEIKPGLNKI